MNVISKNSAPVSPPQNPSAAPSARDRAIAMLSGQQQQSPVANPSSVSPEEMTAIQPSSGQIGKSIEPVSQDAPKEANKEVSQESGEPLSTQYAILAKKEKALRAKAQQHEHSLKSKESELLAREEALKAKESEYQNNYISKSKLSEDTITTLLEAGITYDQITQMALNQGQTQTDPQVKLAIRRLEDQIKAQAENQDKAAKMYQEEQKKQYTQALRQIERDAENLISEDPAFETIKDEGRVKDVVRLIERTFQEDGVILSVEEAATELENHLVEKYVKKAQLKKIQERLKPKAALEQKQTSQDPQQLQTTMKTLTNSVGVNKPLNARERAILAFKGQLK